MMNLICNSIDAIENLEEKWIDIDLVEKKQSYFIVSVTDSGHGIPLENQNKITTPFFTT